MRPSVDYRSPGSAGCQPAVLSSLPSTIFVGKLPALPKAKKRVIEN